ncbi:hypothetical protein SEA_MUSETTA_44 [Microbacterium phage Musetta]|nr:hypothetical protein SEA_MUSETTA_44 [Microbacterium phage Musetta]
MAYTKRGIAPADPNTSVGKFRFAAGDSEYKNYDPPQPAYGLYQLWSDGDIIGLLAVAGGSVARAVSLAYAQIGASFATSGATIKTDDLSVSVKDSVGNWLNLSRWWGEVADNEAANAADDIFDLVDVRSINARHPQPEGAPFQYGEFQTPSLPDFGYDGGTPGNGNLDGGTP